MGSLEWLRKLVEEVWGRCNSGQSAIPSAYLIVYAAFDDTSDGVSEDVGDHLLRAID